ncbi:MAG: type II toxin-antitoxin system RelE/ParE family toxin, partial [Trebonia sp.]
LKQDARQAALTFVDALEDAYVILGQHPVIGAASYATELDIPELRSWALPRFSYVIFYVERKDHIDGWPVLHGRRDIPALVEDPDPE